MDDAPLVSARDRFSTGLPGRRVPVSDAEPTPNRPWGMDYAVVPRPVDSSGRHEKPTENRTETRATQHSLDSRVEHDSKTVTVTD